MIIVELACYECFEYGNMGEVSKQTRIYNLPFMQQGVKLETRFEYDSWGRTLNMTYPDGEKVTYGYDKGGMLKSMHGVKGTSQYSYLKNLQYDKFGAKTQLQYGNNLSTNYSYNSLNLRLASQGITSIITQGGINYIHNFFNASYT